MVDESDQDALIPNYSNKRFGNDDDVDACKLKLMLLVNLLLLIRIVSSIRIVKMHLDYDLNDNLFITDKEVKRVVDSSDEDIDLRTV